MLLALGLVGGATVAPATASALTGPDGQPVDTIRLVSQNLRGKAGSGDEPSASDNARWVAYASRGGSLVEGSVCPAEINEPCAYLTDRKTKTAVLASPPRRTLCRVPLVGSRPRAGRPERTGDGCVLARPRSPPNGQSWRPTMSGDGSFVMFASIANNLTRDGSRHYNVYAYRVS